MLTIEKRILNGRYTLSPLILQPIAKEKRPRRYNKNLLDNPPFFFKPTQEDNLVLTAFGRMLNTHFKNEYHIMDVSYDIRTDTFIDENRMMD